MLDIFLFLQESNGSPQSDASNTERISEDDTNGQSNEDGVPDTALRKSLISFFISIKMLLR
jgi:hypothetical protein